MIGSSLRLDMPTHPSYRPRSGEMYFTEGQSQEVLEWLRGGDYKRDTGPYCSVVTEYCAPDPDGRGVWRIPLGGGIDLVDMSELDGMGPHELRAESRAVRVLGFGALGFAGEYPRRTAWTRRGKREQRAVEELLDPTQFVIVASHLGNDDVARTVGLDFAAAKLTDH